MANTLATPYWPEIRRLAEQGVPLPKLAEDFGLAVNTIYNKSAAEDWLTPSRVRAKVEKLTVLKQKHIAGSGGDPLLGGKSIAEKSESLILETWETRAADLRNLSYNVAVEAIQAAKGQIVIESASDLKHAVHVARQATGILDADAPQIQLSLFANQDISGPAIMEAQTYEAETLQPVSEDADFWG
jgi:hypothetical protein